MIFFVFRFGRNRTSSLGQLKENYFCVIYYSFFGTKLERLLLMNIDSLLQNLCVDSGALSGRPQPFQQTLDLAANALQQQILAYLKNE